jgi:hypothetical protein
MLSTSQGTFVAASEVGGDGSLPSQDAHEAMLGGDANMPLQPQSEATIFHRASKSATWWPRKRERDTDTKLLAAKAEAIEKYIPRASRTTW